MSSYRVITFEIPETDFFVDSSGDYFQLRTTSTDIAVSLIYSHPESKDNVVIFTLYEHPLYFMRLLLPVNTYKVHADTVINPLFINVEPISTAMDTPVSFGIGEGLYENDKNFYPSIKHWDKYIKGTKYV